ncbi:uncharacterized protein B0H18DRAFT_957786 [Fomitopsis serialis]|uniref:uncharacterized protein n=1 Tax=Fomitopsis serialis TaxID=139415 RepID=UPI002007B0DE|nr:uncharacterized protein B0H18DRAFT_957786 [Neoantrodia serialis]KAH9918786.1 hypothetical protein B0H18DRAFT_957786 [Neoantrodia serialis]
MPRPHSYWCTICARSFPSRRNFAVHNSRQHKHPKAGLPRLTFRYHPHINGRPCNSEGHFLPPGAPPPEPEPINSYAPFENRPAFQFAELIFKKIQASQGNINDLLRSLAAYNVTQGGSDPPFEDAAELYETIDAIPYGDAPWTTFTVQYSGPVDEESPSWKRTEYVVHCRNSRQVAHNMIGNEDFTGQFDTTPYQEYITPGKVSFSNTMSGQWAYRQATKIAQDPETHGSMLTPVILGADKTTVSVGTGNSEFHPLYMSIGNVHNAVRRAHKDAIIPIAFLAIPKAARGKAETDEFRTFRKQLYHASIAHIMSPLRPYMETHDVVRCPDGHFRRTIYELGPFIADYPEQVLLAGIVTGWCPKCLLPPEDLHKAGGEPRCLEHTVELIRTFDADEAWVAWGVDANIIPFTTYFPRADIYELITPDLLHQLIKGTFKDHLVDWVEQYLYLVHPKAEARRRMDDIDRRRDCSQIAAAPQFPGLRRFPEGRNFKQWTGNDSKALMKVYLPAIRGHVPDDMVRCFAAYLDFCYLARRSTHDDSSLAEMQEALDRFHRHRVVFETVGVRPEGFSLPRQHALVHYIANIRLFGSPNGICSSITESKHIRAVKQPWQRSSRNNPLPEMLRTNQRLDKLSAARSIFANRHMLDGDVLADAMNLGPFVTEDVFLSDDNEPEDEVMDVNGYVEGVVELPARQVYMRSVEDLAAEYQRPDLMVLVRRFLFDQLHATDEVDSSTVDLSECPRFLGKIAVYRTAHAMFFAPSELSGDRGMHRELIRCNHSWRGHPRYDTVLISIDADEPSMKGMAVGRVMGLMTIPYSGERYPCALIDWFEVSDDLDDMTVYGDVSMPIDFHFSYTLDAFESFYVNNYSDYHSHESIF